MNLRTLSKTPARHDGGDDRGEVVVGEHHRRGLAGDVRSGQAHRDPDVGAAQRGASLTPSPVIATT